MDLAPPVLLHDVRKTTAPLISILVRVRNEEASLPEFWDRLRRQTLFEQSEIIFLDSGSTDSTIPYLLGKPCRVYGIPADTFNFGRSCNQLVELATAPILMLLSGHVLLAHDTILSEIVDTLDVSAREAIFVRQIPNWVSGYNIYEAAYLARRYPPGKQAKKVLGPEGFSNAASAFTRIAWNAQKFPEVHGSEDYLWAKVHLDAGGKLSYLPQIEVLHSHAESPAAIYKRVRLNAQARSATGSYVKALFLLLGIFVLMIRFGASIREASRYAYSHAKAYL